MSGYGCTTKYIEAKTVKEAIADGEAHGFVRLPPRLAAKTTTMAASAGGSAGSPPWLRARQQARAATRDDDDKDEDDRVQRATKALAAGDIAYAAPFDAWLRERGGRLRWRPDDTPFDMD